MSLLPSLGVVVQGSLSQGLEVRLNGDVSVEDMRVGKFLVVQGRRARFFCMLTDVALGTSSQRILINPPDPSNTFLAEVLAGTTTFGTINLTPMLMFIPPNPLDILTDGRKTKGKKKPSEFAISQSLGNNLVNNHDPENTVSLLPVKTVPSHFSQVFDAIEEDFRIIFGWEDNPH